MFSIISFWNWYNHIILSIYQLLLYHLPPTQCQATESGPKSKNLQGSRAWAISSNGLNKMVWAVYKHMLCCRIFRFTYCKEIQRIFVLWNVTEINIPWNTPRIIQTVYAFLCSILDHYSVSGRTSYRKISRSLEAARFGFQHLQWSYCAETWQAPRKHRCRDACQMSAQYDHCNIQSRGFETSRDLAVRRLTA